RREPVIVQASAHFFRTLLIRKKSNTSGIPRCVRSARPGGCPLLFPQTTSRTEISPMLPTWLLHMTSLPRKDLRRSSWLRNQLRRFRPRLEVLEDRLTPAPLTVTNTLDMGAGSLRQAILDANGMPGDDVITFATGVTGTINLASALPDLSSNIDLEGPG